MVGDEATSGDVEKGLEGDWKMRLVQDVVLWIEGLWVMIT